MISSNNGILLNGVLRAKFFNIPLASYFLINLELLLLHIAHLDNIIVLSFLVFEPTIGQTFLDLNNNMTLFYIWDLKKLLINSLCLIPSSMPIYLPSSIRLIFSVSLLWLFIIPIVIIIKSSWLILLFINASDILLSML